MNRPVASSAVYPKSCSAMGFQDRTRKSSSTMTMAVGLSSNTDSKYRLWCWSSVTSW
jgi:hypothetical protein